MNGTIFDIKKFAVHDGPGIRTTVFFKGCPLRCAWCHNPEGISPEVVQVVKTHKVGCRSFYHLEPVGRIIAAETLIQEILSDKVFMEESDGGVTFSGGEPFMQYRFLLEMLHRCRNLGIHTVVDTTVYTPTEYLLKAAEWTNLFLVDLKVMDEALHLKYTGVSNQKILHNLKVLSKRGIPFRIRIPVIPGVSFNLANTEAVIRFLKHLPVSPHGIDLLPYHNTGNHKFQPLGMKNAFQNMASLNTDELEDMKRQMESAGFEVHIGG